MNSLLLGVHVRDGLEGNLYDGPRQMASDVS